MSTEKLVLRFYIGKPRIRKLMDRYAVLNAKHWVCEFQGVCARGATPGEAYRLLMNHFDEIRTLHASMRRHELRRFA